MLIELTSYNPSHAVELDPTQRDALKGALPSVEVSPASGRSDAYVLRAQEIVGSITVGNIDVVIRPRIDTNRAIYLLSWSLGLARWQQTAAPFGTDDFVDAIAAVFIDRVNDATVRGLLHGYRSHDDALQTVRGRIRIDDQVRDRFGRMPPVEVRFDEYTDDVIENRLLLAAIVTLRRARLRSAALTNELSRLATRFGGVTDVDMRRIPPNVHFTRLNEHYRPAVELARLILRSRATDAGSSVRHAGLLFNMNEVFEGFVHQSLLHALRLDAHRFPKNCKGRRLHLDAAEHLSLEPDLSWWEGGECRWVGDAKFKQTKANRAQHPDVYQLLAYLTATGLSDGMLVYAAGETRSTDHFLDRGGRRVRVRTLDVALPIPELERAVQDLADEIAASASGVRINRRRHVTPALTAISR